MNADALELMKVLGKCSAESKAISASIDETLQATQSTMALGNILYPRSRSAMKFFL